MLRYTALKNLSSVSTFYANWRFLWRCHTSLARVTPASYITKIACHTNNTPGPTPWMALMALSLFETILHSCSQQYIWDICHAHARNWGVFRTFLTPDPLTIIHADVLSALHCGRWTDLAEALIHSCLYSQCLYNQMASMWPLFHYSQIIGIGIFASLTNLYKTFLRRFCVHQWPHSSGKPSDRTS